MLVARLEVELPMELPIGLPVKLIVGLVARLPMGSPVGLAMGLPVVSMDGEFIVHSNKYQSYWLCDNQLFCEMVS